ncbi:MAG: hypothetical protein Q7R32_12375 [Dehalococcoidia bacterium]|nr:hypothetical protein [Dehalococcoidia bacterium]
MRRVSIVLLMAVAAVILLLARGGDTARAAPDTVLAGYDLLHTDSGMSSFDFSGAPVPGAAFDAATGDTGCNNFAGSVFQKGAAFNTFSPNGNVPPEYSGLSPTAHGGADTMIRRLQNAGPSFPDTIDIEIVRLELRSVAPFSVTGCTGGNQQWEMKAQVFERGPAMVPPETGAQCLNNVNDDGDTRINDGCPDDQALGSMTIRHQGADGGTFDSTLPVRPLITFTRVGGPPAQIGPCYLLDPPGGPAPAPGCPPEGPPGIDLQALNAPWCHTAGALAFPPGEVPIEVAGLTSNFFPGVTCEPDGSGNGGTKLLTEEEAAQARHGVLPAEPIPPRQDYRCYDIVGDDPPDIVNLETQFGLEKNVAVGQAVFLCPPVVKNGEGDLPDVQDIFPHLKCYQIAGDNPPDVVKLTTQFGIEPRVPVGMAKLLCAPALKQVLSPVPEPPPPGPVPAAPHYKCYDIPGHDPDITVHLETQFGSELGVPVGQATLLCAPALKAVLSPVPEPPQGDLTAPHLKCYNIPGDDPPHIVRLETQFGIEPSVPVGQAKLLCVVALKELLPPVGGIAEPLGQTDAPAEAGTGSSPRDYAAPIAAAVAGAVFALAAGGWYVRRRWLR